MSRSYRSYDEDWQRRKSLMIRSLFHDIPILSPVPEESNESSNLIPLNETYDGPSRSYCRPSRPYSPLPPLIIERIGTQPNKHDEPEEYYRKLLTKIKKIYRKLFIENQDLSSDEYNLSDNYNSLIDDNLSDNYSNRQDNSNSNPLNDSTTEDSDITNSDGYGADFESNYSSDFIDVVNNSNLNQDEIMRCEAEVSEYDNSGEQEVINREEFVNKSIGGQDANKTERCNNIWIENQYSIDREECINMRIKDWNEERESDNRRINDQKINDNDSNNLSIEDPETSGTEESSYIRMDDQEMNRTVESNNSRILDLDLNEEEGSINGNNYNPDAIVNESNFKSKKSEETVSNYENEFVISNIEVMEEDAETNISSEGTDYKQITTEAQIHVDGSQDNAERESRVYEDSLKSIILPCVRLRRVNVTPRVDLEDTIEELAVLEDNEDPETNITFDTDENKSINEYIEMMRTPQPKVSHESIPIRRHSDSDISREHIGLSHDPTDTTRSSVDCDYENNKPQLKTSDAINDILASIFNESHSRDEISYPGRKRKLHEDISVQTGERVTWDELRGNFFVGPPKIFRLCACVGHICD